MSEWNESDLTGSVILSMDEVESKMKMGMVDVILLLNMKKGKEMIVSKS